MAVTIKDIARQAGVSIATISRALTGRGGVGPEMRQRILKIAGELNYYPNLQARGLVANRPDVIGIVIPQTSEFAFSNPYYAELLKGIESKARESGQYLVFSFSGEESYARMYHHRLAAGIIVLANRIGDPRIEEARRMSVPMVLIPGDPGHRTIPSVDGDNAEGVHLAVAHLAGLGHRRIAFMNGPMNSKYCLERISGFHRALQRQRLRLEEKLIVPSDFTQQAGYAGMKRLLARKNPPTAVIMINDYSALGALRAAKEGGLRVPEDVSIVGFGDVLVASMTEPPLTTVREPFQEMGREAVDMLLKVIRGEKSLRKHLVLPLELVIRESTAPPRSRHSPQRSPRTRSL